MTSERYEVLAVRYGTRRASAAEVFLNYHAYREPDRPLRMDYFFWVARSPAAAAPHVLRVSQRLLAQFDEEERARFMDYLGRVGDRLTPR